SAYLTLHSAEMNAQASGEPRIDLNGSDLAQLQAALQTVFEPHWVTYILAYRQYGPYTGSAPASFEQPEAADVTLDLSREGKTKYTTVLDLIDSRVRIRERNRDAVVLDSPFSSLPSEMDAYLPVLLDAVTVNSAAVIPGRININQASRVLLQG